MAVEPMEGGYARRSAIVDAVRPTRETGWSFEPRHDEEVRRSFVDRARWTIATRPSDSARMHVGIIGLGNMGRPMAANLLGAGHTVTVYNRTRARSEALAAQGARIAERPAELAGTDAIITMLADDRAVEGVVFDPAAPDRLNEAFGPRTIHVSMSTISVALARRLTAAHQRAGAPFVSAPVFGRPEVAAAAKLVIIAGGDARDLDRCRPIFDALGRGTHVVGDDPARANAVKLSGNFLIASMIESLGEAFALTRKHGLDPERYREILDDVFFRSPIFSSYAKLIATEAYAPPGFRLPLGLKDVRLTLGAAEAAAVSMPVARLLEAHFVTAIDRGMGELDWSALAKIAADDSGL